MGAINRISRRIVAAGLAAALLVLSAAPLAAQEPISASNRLMNCGLEAEKDYKECIAEGDRIYKEMRAEDDSFWGWMKAAQARDDHNDYCEWAMVIDSLECAGTTLTSVAKSLLGFVSK